MDILERQKNKHQQTATQQCEFVSIHQKDRKGGR